MSVTLKGGHTVEDSRLGRVPPVEWKHVDKYPMRAADIRALAMPLPICIGVNWYRNFYEDRLIERKNGTRTEWWVPEGDLGALLGGHALVLEPFTGKHRDAATHKDGNDWWGWHDQVSEGICVSEACARLMAMLNRRRYQPRPIYDHAQTIDYWPGESYEGTSVDAGLATLRHLGAVPAKRGEQHFIGRGQVARPFQAAHGIVENRWATDESDVFRVLGDDSRQYAVWLNSWGRSYPHRVYVPRSVIERLRAEDGEFGIVVDRP